MQGFWPDGVYTAPTDEALASDIKFAKSLGMNLLRKHIKVTSILHFWRTLQAETGQPWSPIQHAEIQGQPISMRHRCS